MNAAQHAISNATSGFTASGFCLPIAFAANDDFYPFDDPKADFCSCKICISAIPGGRNLYQRKSARTLSGSAENLTEDFTYDNLYRVQTAVSSGGISRTLTYGYNALGNMTSRSDIAGTLAYDKTTGGGVHAVSAVNGVSYQYDTKGNMTHNGTRTLAYTVDNNPSSIIDSATTDNISFQYGADRQRIYQNHANTNTGRTTDTKYYEGEFEVVSENGEKVREKTYIGGFMVLTKVYKKNSAASSGDLSYLHKDHLGSTDAITTQAAADEGRMLFDPFGKRRQDNGTDEDATYKATLADKTFSTTTKGYTGHEQLDSVGLIHMGGRVYDPYIGRFLSPDEHVQYPEFTQSYNRYSYVLNNPLSYTDPTGEQTSKGEGSADAKPADAGTPDKTNETSGIGATETEYAKPKAATTTPDAKTDNGKGKGGDSFASRIGQRFENVIVNGNFNTDKELNEWGAGFQSARAQGSKAQTEYMRQHPALLGSKALIEMAVVPESYILRQGVKEIAEETAEQIVVRTTRSGDTAIRVTRADGSVIDISPNRVKEYVLQTHPKAPPGTLDQVKFPNAQPGSKGLKRDPTLAELERLKSTE